ncbi:heptaprenyl diphosphate synthase [Fervidobacterium changbaicum]|uniref:Heptaprenyl diphosphate synthase n=1 Tax=Fervidobacterium changbaicum TaxID=310769 RepID=A0ABX5QTD4_9BACT|nr:heptaprenyl diphosphate synthase [Fervidobacterium changbaicum]SDH40322.1 heptaprenyl diphosphate synthase [Fervidobacterium changbaicum]
MVVFGTMIALSSVVYVVEGLVPFPVPGGKWGFSNFLVLYLSVFSGLSDALLLAVSKSLLGSILSGTIFTPGFFMGFFGSIASAVVQSLFSRVKLFGVFGISILGMVTNNLVQFVVGSFLIGSNAIFVFLPLVMTLGTLGALANAYLAVKTHKIMLDMKMPKEGVEK